MSPFTESSSKIARPLDSTIASSIILFHLPIKHDARDRDDFVPSKMHDNARNALHNYQNIFFIDKIIPMQYTYTHTHTHMWTQAGENVPRIKNKFRTLSHMQDVFMQVNLNKCVA